MIELHDKKINILNLCRSIPPIYLDLQDDKFSRASERSSIVIGLPIT